jgi:hypothetical protein
MATWKKVVIESASGTIVQDTTGNAATATALETARTIGGVSFDGTANINLPGVNTSGTQNTSGNAATATALATSRNFSISGDVTASAVGFDGTGNVTLSANIASNVVGATELNVSGNGTSGQILSSDGDGSFSWINAASGTLSGLTDTNISSPSADHILIYDGTEWDNAAVSGDVSLSGGSFRVNSVQANAVALGTSTTGNYVATIAGTTNEIEVSGSGSETAAVTIGLPSNVTIGNNLTVTGDLTVNGTTTTINTSELHVEDKLVKIANVTTPTTTTANGAGIQVESSATEAEWPEFKWSNSANLTGWQLSTHNATSSTMFEVAVMQFGTTAPSSPAIQTEAGAGAFFADTTGGNLYLYI